ncbi:hypothetical protein F4808DRAFT_408547 [Astrocystis sublimbata]|nr:hypothetical protein F4808DRAFT_408547 [Astrocystis sublimbata]
MAYVSGSEDEFPEIEVVVARRQKKTSNRQPANEKQDVSKKLSSHQPVDVTSKDVDKKTPPTARRVRKLGRGPTMDSTLSEPWQGSNLTRGLTSRAAGPNKPAFPEGGKKDIRISPAGEILDRLPAKAKHTSSGSDMLDSPPKEQKKSRRLISRGEKKALIAKAALKEDEWIVPSDESDSDDVYDGKNDIPLSSEDEESDFILGGDSDSDELSMTPPRRSQSPNGPRRMQRRMLSSSRDPVKKKTTVAVTNPDKKATGPSTQSETRTMPKRSTTGQTSAAAKSSLEDVFEKLKIFNESESEELIATTPTLEPMTPRKKLTASPDKLPRIPPSPWKPEHKEFWDPEANFAWIDKHSPPKKDAAKKKAITDVTAADNKEELKRRYGTSPEKKQAKKAFDAVKEELARDFLLELDEVVTDGKLARLTEATGGLRIVWSTSLLSTAGRAHWKCKTTTTTAARQPSTSSTRDGSSALTTKSTAQHYASIELATKVLSNESDLLNTVAHEFCHLAVFLLHGKPKQAHGVEFKTFGQRVMLSASGRSDRGGGGTGKVLKTPRDRGISIDVTTRHSYEIEYRFVWRCADCASEVSRHSRSVDPTRQRCGRCKQGILVQVKPIPRGGATTDLGKSRDIAIGAQILPKTEKKKTAYQEFTSREMKALSVTHKGLSFGEKMAVVSARWGEHQKTAKTKTEGGVASVGDGVKGLAAAVEVLEIGSDDISDEGSTEKTKGAYDIFA